jgi:hypothetical protein
MSDRHERAQRHVRVAAREHLASDADEEPRGPFLEPDVTVDHLPQPGEARRLQRLEFQRAGLLHQTAGDIRKPKFVGHFSRPHQALAFPSRLRRQRRRPLERRGRNRHSPAPPRCVGVILEVSRKVLVIPDRGHRPVPQLALWISNDLSQSRIRRDSLRHGCLLPQRRPNKRMAEAQLAGINLDQANLNRRVDRRNRNDVSRDRRSAADDLIERSPPVQRRGQQAGARVRGQLVEPRGERPLEPHRQRQGRERQLLVNARFRWQRTRQLDQRQRVPGGRCEDPCPHDRMEPRRSAIQQAGRCLGAEPLQLNRGQPALRQSRCISRSSRSQECHWFQLQPPGNESQDCQGGLIEPVRVVHNQDQRTGLRRFADQLMRRQRHPEQVGLKVAGDAERRLEHAPGPIGQHLPDPEDRLKQLMQPGKRKLGFRLNTRGQQ